MALSYSSAIAALLNNGEQQVLPISMANLIELAANKENFGTDAQSVQDALSYLAGSFEHANTVAKTAEDNAEEIFQDFEATETFDITKGMDISGNEMIQSQLKQLNDGTISYQQFLDREEQKNKDAMNRILMSQVGQQAYADKYNIPIESLQESQEQFNMLYAINNFYTDAEDFQQKQNNEDIW